jgi:hypothetical protein
VRWIKHSIFLASIIALFVLGFSSTAIPFKKSSSKEQRLQSVESIQSVGLIQSISASQIQVVVKENKTSLFNFLFHLVETPSLFVHRTFTPFLAQQDINRCESVSKLLFPYHIFW